MYVLGVAGLGLDERGTLGHDPAAALLKDGEIVAAAEEERFTRVKHAPGYFPYRAVKFCLDYAGIGIEQVDRIAGYWKPELVFRNAFLHEGYYAHPVRSAKFYLLWKMYEMKYRNNIRHIAYTLEKDRAAGDALLRKFTTVEHHLCHAASAYYCSGFKDATIVTMDGMGENVSTLVGENAGTDVKKIIETYSPHSLGIFYTLFTEYLGFEPNEAEYKVMGLAPYGKPGVKMDDLLWTGDGRVYLDKRLLGKFRFYSDYLAQRFGPVRRENGPLEQRHKDIAYALQERLQKVSLELVKWALEKTGKRNLALAGGVCMNSKMNGMLWREAGVDDIFIQPAAGDNGTALGAALYLSAQEGCRPKKPLEHLYYGPEYSDEQMRKTLDTAKVKYEKCGDIAGEVAELLAKGKIVGWFQGRMEFAARALGNRSILADPTDASMKDKVNAAIKFREGFRPFCPSMLAEAADEYLEQPHSSPFMILTFETPEKKQREVPAVVHVDGTMRPQTVEKHVNPKYYRLISEFEKESGVPVVLNTSFNVSGEPIVCAPKDALRTFYVSGLDYLAMGDYLVKKAAR